MFNYAKKFSSNFYKFSKNVGIDYWHSLKKRPFRTCLSTLLYVVLHFFIGIGAFFDVIFAAAAIYDTHMKTKEQIKSEKILQRSKKPGIENLDNKKSNRETLKPLDDNYKKSADSLQKQVVDHTCDIQYTHHGSKDRKCKPENILPKYKANKNLNRGMDT